MKGRYRVRIGSKETIVEARNEVEARWEAYRKLFPAARVEYLGLAQPAKLKR
jgi:hypothetical protein